MVLRIEEGKILLNNEVWGDLVRLNIEPAKKGLRLYLKSLNNGVEKPIDLILQYQSLKVGVPTASITIVGQEVFSGTKIHMEISYNIFQKSLHVVGAIDGYLGIKRINNSISNITEILPIIKSAL